MGPCVDGTAGSCWDGPSEKGEAMEEMNVGEILKETAEENQTRKILELLNESTSLDEAKAKVKALLEK